MKAGKHLVVCLLCGLTLSGLATRVASAQGGAAAKSKVILDTDIGDDIDDAFALALALRSPEIELLGVTTAWGDTALRARLVNRFLKETGAPAVPVVPGIATKSTSAFSQARWAEEGASPQGPTDAVQFLLEQARKSPGEVTLVAIGPLTNVGAAIDRDAAAFRKFKRVVLMGGAIRRGYGDLGYGPDRGPQAEYNIHSDIPAAQKLFSSGLPIFMMPLDSTQLMLDEVKRAWLFSAGTPLTNALAALNYQWGQGQRTPTLFDAMAVAYAVNPALCPVESLHITVDREGFTRATAGEPNASACLASDSEQFFRFALPRLAVQQGKSSTTH